MSTTNVLTHPLTRATERLAQALTDEQPMVEDNGSYREYVQETAREHVFEVAETFEVQSYSEWLADRELDARVERGMER